MPPSGEGGRYQMILASFDTFGFGTNWNLILHQLGSVWLKGAEKLVLNKQVFNVKTLVLKVEDSVVCINKNDKEKAALNQVAKTWMININFGYKSEISTEHNRAGDNFNKTYNDKALTTCRGSKPVITGS